MEIETQDITGIANYAGTWSKVLISQLLNSLDIVNDLKVIYNVKAPLNLSKLKVGKGIRPLDTSVTLAFNPGRTWSKRTLKPRVGMKIFEIIPEELRDTWMSEMLDPNATDVPLADWVWQQEFAKMQQEINDTVGKMVYNGEASDFDPAAVYAVGSVVVYGPNRFIYQVITLTTAGQTPDTNPAKFVDITLTSICDGPETILATAISDGSIPAGNIIATGVIDSTNAVAKLRQIWLGAPEVFRKKQTKMYISYDTWEAYKTNYEATHPYFPYDKNSDTIYLNLSGNKCELVPCTWRTGTQKVALTLPDNWLMGTNLLDDVNGIGKMIPTLHGFNAICKFILCFEIADPEQFYVNDQA